MTSLKNDPYMLNAAKVAKTYPTAVKGIQKITAGNWINVPMLDIDKNPVLDKDTGKALEKFIVNTTTFSSNENRLEGLTRIKDYCVKEKNKLFPASLLHGLTLSLNILKDSKTGNPMGVNRLPFREEEITVNVDTYTNKNNEESLVIKGLPFLDKIEKVDPLKDELTDFIEAFEADAVVQ